MSDFYRFDPDTTAARQNSQTTTRIIRGLGLFLLIAPPAISFLTENPAWMAGWAVLLILGMAG